MVQLNSAYCCRVSSVSVRSLVAQYATSPSGATILNTLTSPYPDSQTAVPLATISVRQSGRCPCRSRLTRRLDFSRVSHVHPSQRRHLRFSKLLYRSEERRVGKECRY